MAATIDFLPVNSKTYTSTSEETRQTVLICVAPDGTVWVHWEDGDEAGFVQAEELVYNNS
jgi:hypothetical protein